MRSGSKVGITELVLLSIVAILAAGYVAIGTRDGWKALLFSERGETKSVQLDPQEHNPAPSREPEAQTGQTDQEDTRTIRDLEEARGALKICTQGSLEKSLEISRVRLQGSRLLAEERVKALEWQSRAEFRYELYSVNWLFGRGVMVGEYRGRVQDYLEAGGSCEPPRSTLQETPVVYVLKTKEVLP